MSIKRIRVEIKGKSPLIMRAHPYIQEKPSEKQSPEEQAEEGTYRDPNTRELFIPGINIHRCLINGGTYSKGKGRASLQKLVAASVMVENEHCWLGTKDYVIDGRWVVIQKGRVMRYRPRLNEWQTSFTIIFDDNLLTENQLRKVVDDSGDLIGLLEFRPEKKGPFGRFMVVEWKQVKA